MVIQGISDCKKQKSIQNETTPTTTTKGAYWKQTGDISQIPRAESVVSGPR